MLFNSVIKHFGMKYATYLLIAFISLISISCNAQDDCSDMKESFATYEQAREKIEKTNFYFQDTCNTSKSSWILEAQYYSCDNQRGYFSIRTKRKTYIHKNLPKALWIDFKHAESFGKFYSAKIKGNYQLII